MLGVDGVLGWLGLVALLFTAEEGGLALSLHLVLLHLTDYLPVFVY